MIETRLRPAYEIVPACASAAGAAALALRPDAFLLPDMVAWSVAAGLGGLALWRAKAARDVLAYRTRLVRLPRYEMRSEEIPCSDENLFLGRGFEWTQTHAQRLFEARDPARRRLLPKQERNEAGGDPALHGVGMDEEDDVWIPLADRVGHTLVLGTTRVGKTRLLELLVAQDIRRGDVVIVFDPKGDDALLARMYAEAKRAGREDRFYVFHLGRPEMSARYNAVANFSRITEVATRVAGQLSAEGDSAAFREFAWRFTNIIAQALLRLGRKPDYRLIARYVRNIEPLLVEYCTWWLDRHGPPSWREQVGKIEDQIDPDALPVHMRGRDVRAIAILRFMKREDLYDPVADGLRSAFEYDKTYFDKIVASLLPLLEKLTTGKAAELLSPDYEDFDDPRPIIDWMQIIRQRGVVYVGLDALSDAEVASAVGNSMFADLTSVAGQIYKFGRRHGLPPIGDDDDPPISLHADEFNELIGDEFIPMVNKAGGAKFQVTAYTQTWSDVEARVGNRAKAEQIGGNFNTLIMLRVRNEETARLLTDQLPKVRLASKILVSGVTDSTHAESETEFVSRNEDRITEIETTLVAPSDVVSLPKGQAFALLGGGRLWKLRFPLPRAEKDPCMPNGVEEIARDLLARGRGDA
ncbi:MAG: conjugative coupling factor TraD, PFGI-1 class [Deltaproteobacteria bacterium]|nr:MAG: conjugative coupling factor TraD, PFGI-1 class [Deltaproteobacteria bacterium]